MDRLLIFKKLIDQSLQQDVIPESPSTLYGPVRYILSLGGKRLRPVLTLMTCNFFDQDYKKALPAAMAMELFHNFSLIHDDIMDEAPLRRGNQTVHQKWNLNTGILSGDALLILAYQLFEGYKPKTFRYLTKLFSTTALQVCEGQQMDMDFEKRDDVTISEYLKMIEYKTAVLVAASMKMGAIVAKVKKSTQETVYEFGKNLGIAFQLQDDYLDAFGNPETFGKQIGGDIIENKKTYLFLKAIEFATNLQKEEMLVLFNSQPKDVTSKIERVKQLFVETGSAQATQEAIEDYTKKAFKVLKKIPLNKTDKVFLKQFGKSLLKRRV